MLSLLRTCHTWIVHSVDTSNRFIQYQLVKNRDIFISSNFHMHCGGCDNIPFWRWLKVNQKMPTSITCNDFDGEKLSNLQLNEFTDCFSEYFCILSFKRHQMYCWVPVMRHRAKTHSVAPHISGQGSPLVGRVINTKSQTEDHCG